MTWQGAGDLMTPSLPGTTAPSSAVFPRWHRRPESMRSSTSWASPSSRARGTSPSPGCAAGGRSRAAAPSPPPLGTSCRMCSPHTPPLSTPSYGAPCRLGVLQVLFTRSGPEEPMPQFPGETGAGLGPFLKKSFL